MTDTQILQDYCNEARELLEEMDNSLLRIEREGGTSELLNNIFRTVHCIKGSAQYIGLDRSSALTHGLENLLDRLREKDMELDPKVTDLLFRAKDLISILVAEVSENQEEKSDIFSIMQELGTILGKAPADAPQIAAAEVDQTSPPTEETKDEDRITEVSGVGDNLSEPMMLDAANGSAADMSERPAEESAVGTMETIHDQGATGEDLFNREAIEKTASHLLNIALYLDDLQDGIRPSEVLDPLLQTLNTVKRSFATIGMPEARTTLAALEDRLNSIEPDREDLSGDEVEELRSLLQTLKTYFPAELFPVLEHRSTSGNSNAAQESSMEPSDFVREMSGVPGLDLSAAQAIEKAGFFSKEQLSKTDLSTLTSVAGISSSTAEAALRYTGAMNGVPGPRRPPRKTDASMLADVDDELLKEFEQVFDEAFAPTAKHKLDLGSSQAGRAADLLAEVGVVEESDDQEIIEIFLGYGHEVLDKLRPIVTKVGQGTTNRNEMTLCADWIKSIRSSSGYMDYRKLESFLDDWYEMTLWAADRIESLSGKDFLFMQENFLKFQDFLLGMERALNPNIRPAETVVDYGKDDFRGVGSEAAAAVYTTAAEPPESQRPATGSPPPGAQVESVSMIVEEEHPRPIMSTPARPAEDARRDFAVERESEPSEPSGFQEMLMERDSRESAVVRTMRVDSFKVDTLLNQVGELVVNRSYVERLSQDLKDFHRILISVGRVGKKEIQSAREIATKVSEASLTLGRVANDIQEGVMKLRMLPVGQLFNRMPRLIRDLSRRVGKAVNLEVHGADTEVDKRVIEQIYNPLVHLVRNAVDHGIEDKETRKKSGKSEQGLITLRAYSQGSQVVVDVEDDGAGISTSAVLERAVENGLIDFQTSTGLSRQEIYNFLFLPGFSTSHMVTRTSGRGVGMDVVKKDVEKINGHVEIESWENQGTRVSLKIPLTLAIIQTLLVRTANHVFAIPMAAVREIVRITPEEIMSLEGFNVVKFREETIPVIKINEVFKLRNHESQVFPRFLVLSTIGPTSIGLLVEDLMGEQDVVIKPLGEHVFESRGLAGSTILGDGTIALVLDITEIIEDVIAAHSQLAPQGPWQIRSEFRSEDSQTRNL